MYKWLSETLDSTLIQITLCEEFIILMSESQLVC